MGNHSGGIDFVDPGLEGDHQPDHHQCVFPLFHKPLPFGAGTGREFGASRSGGSRRHAAVDLYGAHLWAVRAVADGRVTLASTPFYYGVNEIEIDHGDIGVIRYGEVDAYKTKGLRVGDHVKKGEVIAYIGRNTLDGGTMLHFEMYRGTASGPLTTGTPPYMRRSDLKNPTKFVLKLEARAF